MLAYYFIEAKQDLRNFFESIFFFYNVISLKSFNKSNNSTAMIFETKYNRDKYLYHFKSHVFEVSKITFGDKWN